MKSKKSTTKKRTSNISSSSTNHSKESAQGLNPEDVYINDTLEGMNKVLDFYTQVFGNFIELGSKFAIVGKNLQEECLEYSVDAHVYNSNATKKLSSCKSLPDAVHTHSDFVQNHLNNNVKHLAKLSEFSSELGDKLMEDILRSMDEINIKIKDSCHLYLTKKG